MKFFKILVIASSLILTACNTTKKLESKSQTQEYPKQKITESGHHPFKIIQVKEDSRCPENVTCVWEGRLVVKLGAFIEDKLIEDRTINLNEVTNLDLEWINKFLDTNKSKFIYKLVNASPPRLNTDKIDLSTYKVNIIVQETD